MKAFFKWLCKAIPAGLLALCIVWGICNFYYNPGTHISSETGATDYVWEPGYKAFRSTEGFGVTEADRNGYYNSYGVDSEDFEILLMGSSHMEGGNVKPDENTAYLLNEYMEKYDLSVYNIAVSGHTFLRCVNNLPNALSEFPPEKYVIIETTSTSLDEDSVNEVLNGEMKAVPSYDSGVIYELQKITPFKLFYSQLENVDFPPKINIKKAQADNNSIKEEAAVKSYSHYDNIMQYIRRVSEENGVEVIIFYHPALELDKNGEVFTYEDKDDTKHFRDSCKNNGIVFVDMTEEFTDLYKNEHKLPNGFINTSLGKGHLNKYGHQVVARQLSKVILQLQEEKK